jgi:hypothetical protein
MFTHPLGSLLVSGVQKFHMLIRGEFTDSWSPEVHMHLLIRGEFIDNRSPEVS